MAVTGRATCKVEYKRHEIVIRGSHGEMHREAHRIMRCFACSATPYRLVGETESHLVLKPA